MSKECFNKHLIEKLSSSNFTLVPVNSFLPLFPNLLDILSLVGQHRTEKKLLPLTFHLVLPFPPTQIISSQPHNCCQTRDFKTFLFFFSVIYLYFPSKPNSRIFCCGLESLQNLYVTLGFEMISPRLGRKSGKGLFFTFRKSRKRSVYWIYLCDKCF